MIDHHEFWWRFFPKKELTQIYVSAALRSFAVTLIGVFIPLYLFQEIGYSMQETLLFFVFYATIFAILTPVAAKFAARFGTKHSVLLGVPFYLVYIALLYALPIFKTPLFIIAGLAGASQAFYWIGMHLVFHKASHRKHRGEELGKRKALSIGGAMLGPFLGGYLISTVGFQIVFILAGVFLLVAVAVLFKSDEGHIPYHFSMRSVLNKDHWKNSLFFVSRGTQTMAAGVVWPLFIFFILGSYLSLGIVGSILAGVSAILLWIVGKFSDHMKKRRIIWWIASLEALSWLFRSLVSVPLHVYGASIFGGLTKGVREAPLGALEYDKARGAVAAYFVSREVYLCLGRILMILFVLMIGNLQGALIFQGFASFAALLF